MTKKKKLIIGGIVIGGAVAAVGVGCAIKIKQQKREIGCLRCSANTLMDRLFDLEDFVYDNCGAEALSSVTGTPVDEIIDYYNSMRMY